MKKATSSSKASPVAVPIEKRSRIPQSDIPAFSIDDALKIPKALAESFGFKPASPLRLAQALRLQPSSSGFRMLVGAASAYGLTKGSHSSNEISLEPDGLRIVRPTREEETLLGIRGAILKPRVIREFLDRYDKASLPRPDIGQNVLIEMGVPFDRAEKVFALIVESARRGGFLQEINGKLYVDLTGAPSRTEMPLEVEEAFEPLEKVPEMLISEMKVDKTGVIVERPSSQLKRVFVTHGKNRTFLDPIKKLLVFGELEPVVSVEQQSVSQPVPLKVFGEMRSCGGAIIHVDAEEKVLTQDGKEQIVLNSNVLIEIGAAMALYGKRFILLVREGITLPTNLQGLFEVRYTGEELTGDATLRLLLAISELKKVQLPE